MKTSADSNRSRWKTHPVWEELSNIEWRDSLPCSLARIRKSGIPADDSLANGGLGYLTSFMATRQIFDVDEGQKKFAEFLHRHIRFNTRMSGRTYRQEVAARVRDKGRKFGITNNISSEDNSDATTGRDYQRVRDGE